MRIQKKINEYIAGDQSLGSRYALYAPTVLSMGTADVKDTANGIAAASTLAKLLDAHKKNPDIPSLTELPREEVPVSELSEQMLRDAGFVPSYVAVPEIGQSELRTWRHPFSGMHFHRHSDKWRFHVDTYPSWQMLKRKTKLLRAAGLDVNDPSMFESARHVLQEGLPGYVSYVNGVILGNPRLGAQDTRSRADRFARAALGVRASAALLMLASKATTGEWRPLQSSAAVGSFLGATALSKLLYAKGVEKGILDKMPSWSSMTMLGLAPIAAGVGSYAAANALMKRLRAKKDDKEKKRLDKTAADKPGTYTVQAGDTLSKISGATGVPVRDLSELNKLTDPNKIQVGQVLNISAPPPPPPRAGNITYKATEDDTRGMNAIGAKFGVGPSRMAEANQDKVGKPYRPGDTFVIPVSDVDYARTRGEQAGYVGFDPLKPSDISDEQLARMRLLETGGGMNPPGAAAKGPYSTQEPVFNEVLAAHPYRYGAGAAFNDAFFNSGDNADDLVRTRMKDWQVRQQIKNGAPSSVYEAAKHWRAGNGVGALTGDDYANFVANGIYTQKMANSFRLPWPQEVDADGKPVPYVVGK